jgi:hypothetical protein
MSHDLRLMIKRRHQDTPQVISLRTNNPPKTIYIMATDYFTSTTFRRRLAHVFDLVDQGEKVIIRRGNKQAYTITPIQEEKMEVTPELQAEIEQAEADYRAGKCIVLETREDIDRYLDSL